MTYALTKPEVILTHESDLDGLVSGLLLQSLALRLFGDEVPVEAYNYQSWRQRQPRERTAWVADLAFEPRLDRSGWLIIDHHVCEARPAHSQLIHDVTRSASLLTYELCQAHGVASPTLDRIVHLSNVADLFLEDDPDFTLATDYANLVKTYQFWNLHALLEGDLERLLDHPLLEVMAVKRRVEDPLGLAWSRENVVEITPEVGLVHTVVGNMNLIVHQLLERKATPYSVLLTLFRKGAGVFIVSVRSRNGAARAVAELLQGGGHANASGASLPRSVQSIGDAINYLRDALQGGRDEPSGLNTLASAFAAIEGKK